MKRMIILLISLLTLDVEAQIHIISPIGGQVFCKGDLVTIRWDTNSSYRPNNGSIGINLDHDRSWFWIAQDVPYDSGQYVWTVIIPQTDKVNFDLKLTTTDNGD